MELKEIEYKIACNEMNAAQVFTQMKQHIDVDVRPADKIIGEDGSDTDLTKGVWFQSTVSGLWYQSYLAAGSVRVVMVDGRTYFKDGA